MYNKSYFTQYFAIYSLFFGKIAKQKARLSAGENRTFGAVKQNRTADLFLTKEVLYRLSYNSEIQKQRRNGRCLVNGDPNGARTHDL